MRSERVVLPALLGRGMLLRQRLPQTRRRRDSENARFHESQDTFGRGFDGCGENQVGIKAVGTGGHVYVRPFSGKMSRLNRGWPANMSECQVGPAGLGNGWAEGDGVVGSIPQKQDFRVGVGWCLRKRLWRPSQRVPVCVCVCGVVKCSTIRGTISATGRATITSPPVGSCVTIAKHDSAGFTGCCPRATSLHDLTSYEGL